MQNRTNLNLTGMNPIATDNRAVLYARFSPRPDADECESLEVQVTRCRAYAQMAGLTIVEEFLDPEVSARMVPVHKRESGGKMMEYVQTHDIKHIVVARLDRIFRSSLDGHTVMEHLRKTQTNLHFADQNGCSLNTKTAVGQMIFSVLLAFAEFEPRQTSERTSRALRHVLAKGYRVGQRVMFGRKLDQTNKKKTIPCEEERQVINQMMAWYQEGHHPAKISRRLNKLRILCRGNRWTTRAVTQILRREMESSALYANNPG